MAAAGTGGLEQAIQEARRLLETGTYPRCLFGLDAVVLVRVRHDCGWPARSERLERQGMSDRSARLLAYF